MARLVFAADGTYGDLFPLIPIAQALQRRGHTVVCAAASSVLSTIESAGIPATPVRTAMSFEVLKAERRWLQRSTMRGDRQNRGWPGFEGMDGKDDLEEMCRIGRAVEVCSDLRRVSEGADLLVSNLASIFSPWVAEALSLKHVIVSPQIRHAPARPMGPSWLGSLRAFQGLAFWRLRQLLQRILRLESVMKARRDFGLANTGDYLNRLIGCCRLVLAVSPELLKPSPFWKRSIRIVGHIRWDRLKQGTCSPKITEFLKSGSPPVLVTLGSAASLGARSEFTECISGVLRTGHRALVLTVHEEPIESDLTKALVERYAPLSQVLPACQATIHHGGIGTVHEALRAGLPSIVVPRLEDQPLNARLLMSLGVARVIPWRQLTAERVAAALDSLLRDPGPRRRAQEIACRMASESGAELSANVVEETLFHHRCPRGGHRDLLANEFRVQGG